MLTTNFVELCESIVHDICSSILWIRLIISEIKLLSFDFGCLYPDLWHH